MHGEWGCRCPQLRQCRGHNVALTQCLKHTVAFHADRTLQPTESIDWAGMSEVGLRVGIA